MDVLIFVKLVSEAKYTDSFLDASEERLSSGSLVMNPTDEYALELALRLKDTEPESSLTLVTMGPASAEQILRQGLAMGADRAVHLLDSRFAGSDTLATSVILSQAVKKLEFSGLILCGQKAIDSETGHIGPQMSVHLGIPVFSNVLSFFCEKEKLVVEQIRDEGIATVAYEGMSIITVCRGVEMIRRPTILGMRAAQKKEIEVLNMEDLGLPSDRVGKQGSSTQVVNVQRIRHPKRSCVGYERASEAADMLLNILKDRRCGGEGSGNMGCDQRCFC